MWLFCLTKQVCDFSLCSSVANSSADPMHGIELRSAGGRGVSMMVWLLYVVVVSFYQNKH